MSRKSKTDSALLRDCSKALEEYAEENVFEIKKCSPYQWNISSPVNNMLLAVYPGSGLVYSLHLHYDGTGLLDKSNQKFYFVSKEEMVAQLDKLFFAEESV